MKKIINIQPDLPIGIKIEFEDHSSVVLPVLTGLSDKICYHLKVFIGTSYDSQETAKNAITETITRLQRGN